MKWTRLLVVYWLTTAILSPFWLSSQAAPRLDAGALKQLTQLEQKYLGRNFSTDDDDRRVERLEKLIFGDVEEGDLKQRVQTLVDATAHGSIIDKINEVGGNNKTSESQVDLRKPHAPVEKGRVTKPNDLPDPYPRVTLLENTILGQSYISDELSARLARMEQKAFGKPSDSDDMGDRTDALQQYAEQKTHKKLFTAGPNEEDASGESAGQPPPVSSQSDYPRVTALENAILGQSYVGQPLADRLARMETKAFGAPSDNSDMSERTTALERYAKKTLHKKFSDEQSKQEITTGSSSSQSGGGGEGLPMKLLNIVGNSLFGSIPTGGVNGPMQMPVFDNFGGMRRHLHEDAAEQQQASTSKTRPDDPMVHQADPPPPKAEMIVKVGWCEVQIFGHTFPEMHLPERLTQLNTKLNVRPGKSGIDLMDDVGVIIKAVQAQKQEVNAK